MPAAKGRNLIKHRPHARDLRKGRYSIKNGIYLVTLVTKKRKPFFLDFRSARIPVRCLNASPYASTLAYVVMPDHVHWLIQLQSSKTLSQTVQSTKILCTKKVNSLLNDKGTIWQPSFHDHAIRHREALKEMARYVVANPVRARLVDSVVEYPHWDACWI